jgi:hypothetical protein
MKRTGTKWRTEKCGRCGEEHKNYSGKLDVGDVEYVVCGSTNKRMDTGPQYSANIVNNKAYPTIWIKM